MQILITVCTLALLLLLQQPLQFKSWRFQLEESEEDIEWFEGYLVEMHSSGPPRPLTKEAFQRQMIIDPEKPLTDSKYGTDGMKMKMSMTSSVVSENISSFE